MSDYCTVTQVTNQFPFLLNNPNIAQFIAQAQADIDSRLASMFELPLSDPIPPIINLCAVFISGWFSLYSGLSKDLISQVKGDVSKTYGIAEKWLNQLKDGTREIPGICRTNSQIQLSNFNPAIPANCPPPGRINNTSLYTDPLTARGIRGFNNQQGAMIYPDGTPPYGYGAYFPGTVPGSIGGDPGF